MIKSTISKRKYKAIYRLLDRVSPLDFDCGRLCGAACCSMDWGEEASSDAEMGIYLLPGEHKVLQDIDKEISQGDWLTWTAEDSSDYDFPESWKGKVYFIKCSGPDNCRRSLRPMQCRTYPLTPHISKEGELTLVYNDWRTPYNCPLIEDEMPLNDDFIQATFTVWKHLIEDPLIYDLVKLDSEAREEAINDLAEMLL